MTHLIPPGGGRRPVWSRPREETPRDAPPAFVAGTAAGVDTPLPQALLKALACMQVSAAFCVVHVVCASLALTRAGEFEFSFFTAIGWLVNVVAAPVWVFFAAMNRRGLPWARTASEFLAMGYVLSAMGMLTSHVAVWSRLTLMLVVVRVAQAVVAYGVWWFVLRPENDHHYVEQGGGVV